MSEVSNILDREYETVEQFVKAIQDLNNLFMRADIDKSPEFTDAINALIVKSGGFFTDKGDRIIVNKAALAALKNINDKVAVDEILGREYENHLKISYAFAELQNIGTKEASAGIVRLAGYYEDRKNYKDPFILNASVARRAIKTLKDGMEDGARNISTLIKDENYAIGGVISKIKMNSYKEEDLPKYETHGSEAIAAILEIAKTKPDEAVEALALYIHIWYPQQAITALKTIDAATTPAAISKVAKIDFNQKSLHPKVTQGAIALTALNNSVKDGVFTHITPESIIQAAMEMSLQITDVKGMLGMLDSLDEGSEYHDVVSGVREILTQFGERGITNFSCLNHFSEIVNAHEDIAELENKKKSIIGALESDHGNIAERSLG